MLRKPLSHGTMEHAWSYTNRGARFDFHRASVRPAAWWMGTQTNGQRAAGRSWRAIDLVADFSFSFMGSWNLLWGGADRIFSLVSRKADLWQASPQIMDWGNRSRIALIARVYLLGRGDKYNFAAASAAAYC